MNAITNYLDQFHTNNLNMRALDWHCHDSNGENVRINVRLSRSQLAKLRAFFNIHPDLPIHFLGAELYEQGHAGWCTIWLANGYEDKPICAWRALVNIFHALQVGAKYTSQKTATNETTLVLPTRRRIVVHHSLDRGRKHGIAKDRAKQGALNKPQEIVREIRALQAMNTLMERFGSNSHRNQHAR